MTVEIGQDGGAGSPARGNWLAPASLLVAGAGFLATLRLPGLLGETLHAGFEAAVVGGLADWFAVTALFRHPLGIPIPHTDIIRKKRGEIVAQIRATLESDWLSAASIREALGQAPLAERLGGLLSDAPLRAELRRLSAALLTRCAEGVDAAALAHELTPELRRRLGGRPVADDLATLLDLARRHEWDEAAVAAGSATFAEWLGDGENLERVALLLRDRGREWASGAGWRKLLLAAGEGLNLIDWDRLARGTVELARRELTAMSTTPDHPLRLAIRRRMAGWPDRLRAEGEARAEVTRMAGKLLAALPLESWLHDLLTDARTALLSDLARPDSRVLAALDAEADRIMARLRDDEALRARADAWLRDRLLTFVDQNHRAIGDLVVRNLERRDATTWSREIETRIGPDLQYIRVNGALVGGLVGIALSLLGRWLAGR